jgi:hypothetical protein
MGKLVRIFDGIYVSQLFQTNERGETIFYPFGLWGKGYVVPPDRIDSLKHTARLRTFFWVLAGTVCAYLFVGASDAKISTTSWSAIAPIAVLMIAVSMYTQFRMAAGLDPTAEHVSFVERLRRGRKSRPYWSFWVSIVSGSLCIFLGAVAVGLNAFDNNVVTIMASAFLVFIGILGTWDGFLGLSEVRPNKT